MASVSPSREASHDQWLTLSLSTAQPSQPEPEPEPEPQLLPLLQTLQQQPPPPPPPPPSPSPATPFLFTPLVAPTHPFYEQEPHQERNVLAPPCPPSPPPPPLFHNHDDLLLEMRMLPRCDFPLVQGDQRHDQDTVQTRQVRKRKQPLTRATKKGKSETIDPPFPWATPTRATVYSHEHLLANNIKSISGMVKCKGCNKQYDIEFDLEEKFRDIVRFVVRNRRNMHDRAPDAWINPVLPTCKHCGQENALKPVITKKRSTNWLFLLLGQMLGCCTLAHLKFFCKHRMIHCTAAKDRLVYLTYLDLCKQLEPRGPFNP